MKFIINQFGALVQLIEAEKKFFNPYMRVEGIIEDHQTLYNLYVEELLSLEQLKDKMVENFAFLLEEVYGAKQNMPENNYQKLLNTTMELKNQIKYIPKDIQRINQLEVLNKHINKLKEKSEQFQQQNEIDAKTSVDTVIQKASEYSKDYVLHKIELQTFKDKLLMKVDEAHEILDKHRGCKALLQNLSFCIKTLVIGYAAQVIMNGTFYIKKPDTDSKEKLDSLQRDINLLR